MSKTRYRHQPKTSHHLQETSQARFLHLDKTKVKSRIGQGIGDGADLPPRRRGRQATINTRAEIRHRHGGLQTPARRLARQQSTIAAGRTTRKKNLVQNLENRGRPVELPGRREEATGEGNRHLSHVSSVEPTTGQAMSTPTREEIHLTLHRSIGPGTPGTPGTAAGAGGPPAPAGIAVAAPKVTAPAAEVYGHNGPQTQQPYTSI